MGRAKYTTDEQGHMLDVFIKAAREIVDDEGLEAVSIRKIARISGYNSATMYIYFQDIDELLTFSCLSYMEDYCRALAEELKKERSALDTYILTWELFGRYAFTYPQVFHRLFFHPHTRPLEETIKRYYELYPQQLRNISGVVSEMLRGGTLEERDYPVLYPVAEAGVIRREDVELISDVAVCSFRKLLEEKCAKGDKTDNDALMARQMKTVNFLMGIR